jgi:2-C-methyl-D-erythritol 4-phosphate cytidylyltransferase / 2-C-methyl-D-erythritol 2,4-cyclodiphosphate synthase
MRFAAVVAAAGRSVRFGGTKKEYSILDGLPVLAHSVLLFLQLRTCAGVVVVVPPGGEGDARAALGPDLVARAGPLLQFAEGGRERSDSVKAGLMALRTVDPELVLVHDAARPWASRALVERVLAETVRSGACVPAVPAADAAARSDAAGFSVDRMAGSKLGEFQTPQGFQYRGLLSAYLSRGASASTAVDDAGVWVMAGGTVAVVEGEPGNKKVTFPGDLPSN